MVEEEVEDDEVEDDEVEDDEVEDDEVEEVEEEPDSDYDNDIITDKANATLKAPNNLNILSWNLCWGCLGNNTSDFTAITLVKKCIINTGSNKLSVENYCFKNIIDVLSDIINKYNIKIFAFQEATNDIDQINKLTETINSNDKKYTNIMTHADSATLTSYYDNKYFSGKLIAEGNIEPGNGRPFHIIELSNDTSEFYFINLHNGHKKGGKEQSNIYSLIQKHLTKKIDIIIAGDWNDAYGKNYWQSLYIDGRKLDASMQPPKTCCHPTYNKYGDYIISNRGAVNIIYPIKKSKLTSDHKPVIGSISFDSEFIPVLKKNKKQETIIEQLRNQHYKISEIKKKAVDEIQKYINEESNNHSDMISILDKILKGLKNYSLQLDQIGGNKLELLIKLQKPKIEKINKHYEKKHFNKYLKYKQKYMNLKLSL